ncbi:hypothetical protein SAMN05421754_106010 [Nitrosomonas sp. Nm58]|jgi:hypothetical protein|nr:hypothetical protein SAMN05421754_106010 [Nitrosomonas sp. Nm58]
MEDARRALGKLSTSLAVRLSDFPGIAVVKIANRF